MTVIEYIMKNPRGMNLNYVENLLGDSISAEQKIELYKYLKVTPYNTNKRMLEFLIGSGESADTTARVGSAIVGTSVVGSEG